MMDGGGRIIHTQEAPAALGPYSQGIALPELGLVFTAGQIGLDPRTGGIVTGGIAAEMARALDNLEAILHEAGSGLDRVVRTTLYLVDMDEFETANRVYAERVGTALPARSTVQVCRLPKNARVEIDMIATLRRGA